MKNSNKKKMADRFAESNNILIQSLKDNAKTKTKNEVQTGYMFGAIAFL